MIQGNSGNPSRPEIILPDGYEFSPGERHHVASRAEFYTFVQSPRSEERIPVTVRWPGEAIEAVTFFNDCLELEPPAYLPHFWIDQEERTFFNGMNIGGRSSPTVLAKTAAINDQRNHRRSARDHEDARL